MTWLFLDIDGVLNHQEWYEEIWEKRKKKEIAYPYSEFDPKCVERVNRILKETNANLVISSSWRSDPELSKLFREIGLSSIFDKTISQYNSHQMGMKIRGEEIDYFLSQYDKNNFHNKIPNYAILDDDNDFTPYQQKYTLFRTANSPCDEVYERNGGTGLTEKLTNEVIRYLNNF